MSEFQRLSFERTRRKKDWEGRFQKPGPETPQGSLSPNGRLPSGLLCHHGTQSRADNVLRSVTRPDGSGAKNAFTTEGMTMQGLISLYQRYISPFLPQSCRFYPSCSEYARLSFNKYPFHRALIKSIFRILRCHPFHPGGIDFP